MLSNAMIITRREIRDSMRDWRIVVPIVILTVVFPWLMDFSTRIAIDFVERYNATIISIRLIPFALMIVGFFPISFSLVIALETFVGEKERNSLEPLLAMPISDSELYLGKLLAAMLPPLLASYLGILVYLIGLWWTIRYFPPLSVLAQIVTLTSMEALVMVAGAVVVSSHTTSVRAANLLASFIIIPMALLLQAESILLFWGRYDVLWYIVLALAVADVILVRMGVRIFNREDILAREIDQLDLPFMWRAFKGFLTALPGQVGSGEGVKESLTLGRLYRRDIPQLLRLHRLSLAVVALVLLAGLVLGWVYAWRYPLSPEVMRFDQVTRESFLRDLRGMPGVGFLPRLRTINVFLHNLRAILLAAMLALFSFGAVSLILLLISMALVGFLAGEVFLIGQNPLLFMAAFILPHGVVELPAAAIATAFALRLGMSIMAPPPGLTAGESLLAATSDFVKVMALVIPLLLVAAFIEANITPLVVLWAYGG